MLNTPVRPPSKDALRFLRHVVLYSSFGTLAGTTVLLTEERRRRICLLEKIIQNGKRIRSSDRYVHSAAIAERSGIDYFEQSGDATTNSPQFLSFEAAPSPYSSSEIDKAYKSIHGRPEKSSKRSLGKSQSRKKGLPSAENGGKPNIAEDEASDNSAGGSHRETATQPKAWRPATRAENLPAAAATHMTFSERYPGSIRKVARRRMEEALAAGNTYKCLEYFYQYYKRYNHLAWFGEFVSKSSHARYVGTPTTSEIMALVPQNSGMWQRAQSYLGEEDIAEVIRVFIDLFRSREQSSSSPSRTAYVLLNVARNKRKYHGMLELLTWLKDRNLLQAQYVEPIILDHLGLDKRRPNGLDKGRSKWCADYLSLVELLPESPPLSFGMDFMRKLFNGALKSEQELEVAASWRQKVSSEIFNRAWTSAVLARTEHLLTSQGVEKATTLFLRTLHTKHAGPLGADSLEMARRLLDAAWLSGLTAVAENILSWAESYNARTQLFEMSLEAYSGQKAWPMIIWVYKTYKRGVTESQKCYPTVCHAFVKFAALREAIEFMEEESKKSGDGDALEARQSSYSVLIRRLWTETHDFEKVRELFARLQSWTGSQGLSLKVYNAMVLTCVEAGRPASVKGYLRLMGRAGKKPDQITLKHVLLASAMSGDWANVTSLMDRAHTSGTLQPMAQGDNSFFQPILHEYCKQHDASQIEAFVNKAVHDYGLKPDESTSNRVLKVFIEAQQPSRILQWFDCLCSWGYEPQLTARNIVAIFKRYTLSYRPQARFLMRLTIRLNRLKTSIASRQLYSVIRDGMSYDLRRAHTQNPKLMHWRVGRYLTHINQLRDAAPSLPVDQKGTPPKGNSPPISRQQRELESDITQAISLDQPAEAVNIYRRSRASGLLPSPLAVKMAVEASVRACDGDTSEAIDMVRDAEAIGLNVYHALIPLLVKRVHKGEATEGQLRATVWDLYSKMDQYKLHIDHAVAVSAANRLINQRDPTAAVSLLKDVWNSEYARRYPLDIAAMTVFLKAYAAKGSLAGVEWVVHTVLAKDMRIDTGFCHALKEALNPLRIRHQGGASAGAVDNVTGLTWHWVKQIMERKGVQQKNTEKLGLELVRVIRELSKASPGRERPRSRPSDRSKRGVDIPRRRAMQRS